MPQDGPDAPSRLGGGLEATARLYGHAEGSLPPQERPSPHRRSACHTARISQVIYKGTRAEDGTPTVTQQIDSDDPQTLSFRYDLGGHSPSHHRG